MSVHHRPFAVGVGARRARGQGGQCAAVDRPWVLAATILGSSMGFLDGALTGVALPAIGADLAASFDQLQWVQNIYLLALSALIVVGGGLGDRLGRRWIFNLGLTLFAISSVGCAVAWSAETLIAARLAQGIGAAIMIPQSLAIIAASYPREERGAAIGVWASAAALTTSMGPVVGGLMVDALGWRSAFWINPPLAVLAIAISLWRMPETRAEDARGPLDWTGAGLITIGLGALSWVLVAMPDRGVDALSLAMLGVSVAALATLVPVERRAAAPIAPPALFRDRVFVVANLVTLLLYAALGAALFLMPFDLIGRRGYDAAEVGAALLPFGLLIGALSRPAGRLGDRMGARGLLTGASVLFAAGCAALALAPSAGGYWATIFPAMVLMGLGMTAAVTPLTTVALNAAPDSLTGAASGVNNAVSRAAGLLAVAGVGAVAAAIYRLRAAPDDPSRFAEALETGAMSAALGPAFASAYWAAAALALISAVLSRLLPGAPGR